jgi:hypothetical protein
VAAEHAEPPTGEARGAGHGARLTLLVVDPFHVHAYWELALTDRVEALQKLAARGLETPHWVLRFFDVTPAGPEPRDSQRQFDVAIAPEARNWYVDLWSSGRTYFVELGLAGEGEFEPVCRSNVFELPRAEPPASARPTLALDASTGRREEAGVSERAPPAVAELPPPVAEAPALELRAAPPAPAPRRSLVEEYSAWLREEAASAAAGSGTAEPASEVEVPNTEPTDAGTWQRSAGLVHEAARPAPAHPPLAFESESADGPELLGSMRRPFGSMSASPSSSSGRGAARRT